MAVDQVPTEHDRLDERQSEKQWVNEVSSNREESWRLLRCDPERARLSEVSDTSTLAGRLSSQIGIQGPTLTEAFVRVKWMLS